MFEGTDTPALWKLAETADKVRPLQEIDRLSEQVDYWRKKAQSLERELHKEVRTARERPFGNDTRRRSSSSARTRPRRRSPARAARSRDTTGTGGAAQAKRTPTRSSNSRCRQNATGAVASSRTSRARSVPFASRCPRTTAISTTSSGRDGARSATGRSRSGSPASCPASRRRTACSRRTSWTAMSTARRSGRSRRGRDDLVVRRTARLHLRVLHGRHRALPVPRHPQEVRAEIRRPASQGVGAFGHSGFRAFEHLFAQMLTSPDAQML